MTLFLSATAVQMNMQNDAAAFDAWAIVLMDWCGAERVVIDWEEPTNTTNGHYQRFLYRIGRFEELFGPDIVSVARRDRLAESRIGDGRVATLNIAGRSNTAGDRSLPGSEADIEKRLAGANPTERERFMKAHCLVKLDRQMPVGVFDGPPTRAGAIFTGGKSAIDLLGLGRDGALWLLELKTAHNIKVGALSELFFYSMVLRDVRLGRLRFHDGRAGPRSTVTADHVKTAPRIHACLLTDAYHPLLSEALFDRITKAAAGRDWAVDYRLLDLGPYLDRVPLSV
jgi:hypothetical protein